MQDILDLKETQEELKWLEIKLSIKARRLQGRHLPSVRRGEVYWCEFGYNLGSEIRDVHPCVIIQNNASSVKLNTVIVAPVTHAGSRSYVSSLMIPLSPQQDKTGKTILEGYCDVANMKTISKARLKGMIASLPKSDLQKIDKGVAVALDVYGYYHEQSEKLEAAIKRGDTKEQKIKALRNAIMSIDEMIEAGAVDGVGDIIHEALSL